MKLIVKLFVAAAALTATAAGAQGVFPVEPPPAAEIQIFVNYRGPNDYDLKYVSTPERLISAGFVYPSESPFQNGACFYGEPYAALGLFQSMVDMMNAESKMLVSPAVSVYFDPDTYKPALHIEAIDEFGLPFVWFERMRQCDRAATPEERANDPKLPL